MSILPRPLCLCVYPCTCRRYIWPGGFRWCRHLYFGETWKLREHQTKKRTRQNNSNRTQSTQLRFFYVLSLLLSSWTCIIFFFCSWICISVIASSNVCEYLFVCSAPIANCSSPVGRPFRDMRNINKRHPLQDMLWQHLTMTRTGRQNPFFSPAAFFICLYVGVCFALLALLCFALCSVLLSFFVLAF